LGDNECIVVLAADCTSGSFQGEGTSCSLCIPPDCNSNGIPDDQDISFGNSLDCNANGVPDECEGNPVGVDAGSLGIGFEGAVYDSIPNENDLSGFIFCPEGGSAPTMWTVISMPAGAAVVITNPGALNTPYRISPAPAGSYVFQLCAVQAAPHCDTVTLTLLEGIP
jgi:hypothetical protein